MRFYRLGSDEVTMTDNTDQNLALPLDMSTSVFVIDVYNFCWSFPSRNLLVLWFTMEIHCLTDAEAC